MQSVNLNLIPGSVLPVINLTQFDEGRQFALVIYDGSTAADLSSAQILISGKKNDETAFSYDQTDTVKGNLVISVSGNTVTIRNTLQMGAASGDVLATLTVKKSAADVSTLNFVIRVQEHPLDGVDISETEIPGIIALAQAQADEAEAWATGEIDGVPVPSDAPQYENSAEYWAYMSSQYAQGGLKWKGSCTFVQIPTTGMEVGDMWDITDAFTTDARFREGAGVECKAGTNIAWDGTYWDLLATGSPKALPTGGIAGQFLVKQSSSDQDADWGGGVYYFSTVAAAEAAIAGGTVPEGAIVMVDEIGGGVLVPPAISNLADVSLSTLANGNILVYNSTAQKWENKPIDSALSTTSSNPVKNSTIAAALANGRISFGVDGNGDFGFKKDGADTVYPFALGSGISSAITPPVPIVDQVYRISGHKVGTFGGLVIAHVALDIYNDVTGTPDTDKALMLSAGTGKAITGIGVAVPLNSLAKAHPLTVRFEYLSGVMPEDYHLGATAFGMWLCSTDNMSATGQHWWAGAQYEVYYIYYIADPA